MKIIMNRYCKYYLLVLGVFLCSALGAQQYFNTPISQYYRNGYLWNPAYAGSKDHPSIYTLLNNSWIGFDDAPTLAIVSGDLAFGNNSGGGIKIISDKSGLLQRTTATLDYSFSLKFSSNRRLRLGVSAGTFSQRLQNTDNAAAMSDPLVPVFNAKSITVDGNLGAVYENGHFTLGAAFYNLRTDFQKNNQQLDLAKANFMASWDFMLAVSDSISIKPLVSYKLFSESSGLLAMGFQLERNKVFNTSFMWQNTGSVIGNIGFRIPKMGEINFAYASNNKYGYGQQYEIGLGIGIY